MILTKNLINIIISSVHICVKYDLATLTRAELTTFRKQNIHEIFRISYLKTPNKGVRDTFPLFINVSN